MAERQEVSILSLCSVGMCNLFRSRYILMFLMMAMCGCVRPETPLFNWQSCFKAEGIELQHGEYILHVWLADGVTTNEGIQEILDHLQHTESPQGDLIVGPQKAGFEKVGLREKDALALALSQLCGVPLTLYTFDNAQTRDGKIQGLVKVFEK